MNNRDSPLATPNMEGLYSSGYLRYAYVTSLYNTCHSILKAALSAVSLSESTGEEEEDEEEEEEEEEGGKKRRWRGREIMRRRKRRTTQKTRV